jgi:hypothetical protein
MNTTSFLPDKKPVICSVLVHLPYLREDLKKIGENSDSALFPLIKRAVSTWGLLYLGETEIGIFIHPAKPPAGGLLGNNSNAEPLEPVHIHIPYEKTDSAAIVHPDEPETFFEKILAWFSCRDEDRFILSWNEDCQLEAYITTDSAEFERELLKKKRT